MLNSRREKVRIFKSLVNFTTSPISLYDDGGNIVTIEPSKIDISSIDINPNIGIILHNRSDAQFLGIPHDNAVIVGSTGVGRDGISVSNLIHATDSFRVIFSPNSF